LPYRSEVHPLRQRTTATANDQWQRQSGVVTPYSKNGNDKRQSAVVTAHSKNGYGHGT